MALTIARRCNAEVISEARQAAGEAHKHVLSMMPESDQAVAVNLTLTPQIECYRLIQFSLHQSDIVMRFTRSLPRRIDCLKRYIEAHSDRERPERPN